MSIFGFFFSLHPIFDLVRSTICFFFFFEAYVLISF